jgi:hypothetical protein
MNMIKNNRLKKIIKHIDSTKYKKRTLEKFLRDPAFLDFANELLRSLGFLDKNNSFTY